MPKSKNDTAKKEEAVIEKPKAVKPKLAMNLEYLGKLRPPWNPFFKLWDMVYDEKIGREKRVEVTMVLVENGKVLSPGKATETSQCVAFDVPMAIANKVLRDAGSVWREYDPSAEFVPERDIKGFVEIPDEPELLRQRIKVLEEENADKDRRHAAIQAHLGQSLANKLMNERGAVTAEKDNLRPTKESIAA